MLGRLQSCTARRTASALARSPHHNSSTIMMMRKGLSSLHQDQGVITLLQKKKKYLPAAEEKKRTLAKIVATIGPVSEQFGPLQQIVKAGMRVMRLNFSHATYEEAELRITNLRKCAGVHSDSLGSHFNIRAVLLDIQGPKIRTGSFVEGSIMLEQGKSYVLTTDDAHKLEGDDKKFYVDYPPLYESCKPGNAILIDDGNIVLEVIGVTAEGVECRALNTGRIKNRRGVNVPDSNVDLPALTEKDKKDLRFGVKWDIDFVAASFVRKAKDITDIRAYLAEQMKEFWPPGHPHPQIIAKIESTEGLRNFDDILAVSDGIMVARGDLGVEIPVEDVTNMQKMMVRKCKAVGKPVIVATQMLETMQTNPRPTRAEVSDVTNAVYDGADAVMLSGESAQGKYPVEAVSTMRTIIDAAESWMVIDDAAASWMARNFKLIHRIFRLHDLDSFDDPRNEQPVSVYEATAASAVQAAFRLKASCIIVHTEDGEMARTVAKYGPNVPVMCFTSNQKVARQLIIFRGLHPIIMDDGHLWSANKGPVLEHARRLGFAQSGDKVVVVTGEPQHGDASITTGAYCLEVK